MTEFNVALTSSTERSCLRPSDEGARAARAAGSIGGEAEAAGSIGGEVPEGLRLLNEWASWLEEFRWSHFVTLTFYNPQRREAALGHFKRWIRTITNGSSPVPYVVVVEGDYLGVTPTHLHALVAVPMPTSCRLLENAWGKRRGWARARIYDPSKGGARYLVKQIAVYEPVYEVSTAFPERY